MCECISCITQHTHLTNEKTANSIQRVVFFSSFLTFLLFCALQYTEPEVFDFSSFVSCVHAFFTASSSSSFSIDRVHTYLNTYFVWVCVKFDVFFYSSFSCSFSLVLTLSFFFGDVSNKLELGLAAYTMLQAMPAYVWRIS